MTLSLHELSARFVRTGVELDVKTASVRMEETWAPFVQATIVVVAPDRDTLADLDPRTNTRIRLTGTVRYGDSRPVSVVSQQWTGLTLAGVTSHYQGKALVDISTPLFTPWNSIKRGRPLSELTRRFVGKRASAVGAAYPTGKLAAVTAEYSGIWNQFGLIVGESRSFDLMLRSRTVDYAEGTVTLTLSSDESIMQDAALVATSSWTPTATSIRQLTVLVLAYCGLASLDPGPADGTVDAGALEWKPGVTAWDYLSSIVQQAGLRLWCDERRRFHLDAGTVNNTGPVRTLATAQNIVGATDSISLDDSTWYDAVVVTYTWTNASGNQIIRADTATASNAWRKVLRVERTDVVFPGYGAAAAILSRTIGRGRTPAVRAVTALGTSPGDPVVVNTPDGAIHTGYAASVGFDWPDAEMDVTTRDTTVAA